MNIGSFLKLKTVSYFKLQLPVLWKQLVMQDLVQLKSRTSGEKRSKCPAQCFPTPGYNQAVAN